MNKVFSRVPQIKLFFLSGMIVSVLLLVMMTTVILADDLGDDLSDCVPGNCPAPNFPAVPIQCDTNNFTYFDDAISVFIGGNMLITGTAAETEGHLAVGGDLSLQKNGGYSVGVAGAGSCVPAVSNTDHLIVRGSVTNPGGGNLIVGAGSDVGNAVVGGSVTSGAITFGSSPSGLLTPTVGTDPSALGIDFDAKLREINGRSQCWSILPATGIYTATTNSFVGDGTSSLQVFYVDQSQITGGPTFTNIPDGATVLVNFTSTTHTWDVWGTHWGANSIGVHREQVLFNFYNAISVTLGGSSNGDIEASILSPRSDGAVTMIANHNGRFSVGGDVIQNGSGNEFHNFPFTGELPACDWGDQPDTPYPTVANAPTQAASHVLTPGLYLGDCVDGEPNGQPTSPADGDDSHGSSSNPGETLGSCAVAGDDEDGVAVAGQWSDGLLGGAVQVKVTAPPQGACLNAWIDWTNDGDFNDPVEQIITNTLVISGSATISFTVPTGTFNGIGDNRAFHARYRLTRRDNNTNDGCSGADAYGGVASPDGPADSGEVEDYVFLFSPNAVTISQQEAADVPTFTWFLVLVGALTMVVLGGVGWRLASRIR